MEFAVLKVIDNLGRLAVPVEMRRYYGFELNEELQLVPTEDGILIRKKGQMDNEKSNT